MAQVAAPKARKAKVGRYGAPGAYTAARMNAAINRAGLGRKGASRLPEQTQPQSQPFTKASLDAWSAPAPDKGSVLQTPGDRPFEGSAPTVNPFAPPDSSPGSLWSPPASLQSATNPFKPMASAINPFQGTLLNPVPFAPNAPGFSVPVAQNNPAVKLNSVPTTRTTINSPETLPSPWGNSGAANAPSLSNPGGSLLDAYPKGSPGNPYSLENFFPTSSSGFQRSPQW